jgi:MFS family permease
MPLLSESAVVLPIHRKILAFSFIGWIFDFYDLLLLSFVISTTTLRQDLALSQQDVSVLLGTALAFTAVGGFIGGALGDRYGRKPLLMVTILVYSVGTLLSGMATSMSTLFLARAITGIGVGGEWAVAHALVGETVPPHVRGRYGSYLQSGSAFARTPRRLCSCSASSRTSRPRRRCFRYSALRSRSAGRCSLSA